MERQTNENPSLRRAVGRPRVTTPRFMARFERYVGAGKHKHLTSLTLDEGRFEQLLKFARHLQAEEVEARASALRAAV